MTRRPAARRGGSLMWLVLLLVGLLALGVVADVHHRNLPAQRLAHFCSGLRSPAGRGATAPVSAGRPTVVVLGDSYSSGFALAHPLDAWPRQLGRLEHWQVFTDAVAGTGMVAGALCGQPYATRTAQVLSHRPERVVVQVGLNDTSVPVRQERAAAAAVLQQLRGVPDVDVVGPPPAPAKRPAELVSVDATLRAAAAQAHRRYVSLLDARLPYLPDGVHLTPQGHVELARLVAAALR